jgi:Family of unknown function (DUF6477)
LVSDRLNFVFSDNCNEVLIKHKTIARVKTVPRNARLLSAMLCPQPSVETDMTDPVNLLSGISRPSLLIRAARFGLGDYRRERDLKRLISDAPQENPATVLPRLLAQEERLEESRRSGALAYSLARHVEVLVALMFEARLVTPGPGV